jgi:hypothetical protein
MRSSFSSKQIQTLSYCHLGLLPVLKRRKRSKNDIETNDNDVVVVDHSTQEMLAKRDTGTL